MGRDATLSRLTKTDAGKLGGAFYYLKLASFGALHLEAGSLTERTLVP